MAACGGRFLGSYAPSSAGFECAMSEKQALALAADPRVESVGESGYGLIDDFITPVASPER